MTFDEVKGLVEAAEKIQDGLIAYPWKLVNDTEEVSGNLVSFHVCHQDQNKTYQVTVELVEEEDEVSIEG